MSICTICGRGHTASACPLKPSSNANGTRIADGMRALRMASAPETWEDAWQRLQRDMKGRAP